MTAIVSIVSKKIKIFGEDIFFCIHRTFYPLFLLDHTIILFNHYLPHERI